VEGPFKPVEGAIPKRNVAQPHRRDEPIAYAAKYRETNREHLNAQAREYHAKRKASDPEYAQMKRDAARWARRRAKYDLSQEEYQAMKIQQDGKCAICGETPDHDLRVDHDHTTTAVRGLLCSNCNAGIGFLRENPGIMRKAIEYLAQ
jgi:hypothetical protein